MLFTNKDQYTEKGMYWQSLLEYTESRGRILAYK